jgi:hypothetical protein
VWPNKHNRVYRCRMFCTGRHEKERERGGGKDSCRDQFLLNPISNLSLGIVQCSVPACNVWDLRGNNFKKEISLCVFSKGLS